MLLVLRDQVEREAPTARSIGRGMKLFAWAAARPAIYRRGAAFVRWSLRRLATNGWIRRAPGPAKAWTDFRDLKAPAAKTFQQQWRERSGSRNADRGMRNADRGMRNADRGMRNPERGMRNPERRQP